MINYRMLMPIIPAKGTIFDDRASVTPYHTTRRSDTIGKNIHLNSKRKRNNINPEDYTTEYKPMKYNR